MPTIPDRQALRARYDEAVNQINAARSSINLRDGFYAKTGDAVFDAGLRALANSAAGGPALVHTIAAPVGGGKTSFAFALMLALTRYADENPEGPYGCAFVCDQIEKADAAFRELNALMPGRVAVWTSDHDKNNPRREKVAQPAAQFTRDELPHYPVIVITHKFFSDKQRRHKARNVVRKHDGKFLASRSLFIVDERPQDVTPYELTFAEVQAIKTAMCEKREDLKEHWEALWTLLSRYEVGHDSNTISRPSVDLGDAAIAECLSWYTSLEAEHVFKVHAAEIAGLDNFFGIARALMTGRCAVFPSGAYVYFVGYKANALALPGTVLLDATADVDGVARIAPSRELVPVPTADYANLEIVVTPHHTRKRLKDYLKTASNQRAYVDHMLSVIRAHMAPGERGLVVCKKALFDAEQVPNWGQGDPWFKTPAAYTEGYGWNIDGRELCAVHWGAGVGSNAWHTADVVFLFDEFVIPRRTSAVITQGLRDQRADEGDLGAMTTLRSKAKHVDIIQDGHRISQTKQLALRGRARCYDQHGVCGKQRLVVSCDPKSFLEHKNLLFPGAPDPIIVQGTHKRTVADKVLDFLSSASPDTKVIKTKDLKDSLGKPWGAVSRNVLTERFHSAARGLGWAYRQGKGCKGSQFARTAEAFRRPEVDKQPAVSAFGAA
ncbi:MAG TPA: hypothetical protein VGV41_22095 [Pseudolabrys sp.]|uniref:hypothetical protein n=1 Tax=Pseudolabrys sp. TaxID=1960880 RepID=UPI002DDCF940|nr:hypothetical protein [Pseudolabrys sp.]HEV2631324.1 hypothetical protein [Pseudolabrys sp.]